MSATGTSPRQLAAEVGAVLAALAAASSTRVREEMPTRYGIHTDKAFGVAMASMKAIAKGLGRDHELAAALWATGWYEARMVACLIDDPAQVTSEQMDRWADDFDNWGICDTACFHLFDRTPHAPGKVEEWAARPGEQVRRAAFALLACLALHGRLGADAPVGRYLELIEAAATDDRNFVKKGVSWALRALGRGTGERHERALALARRLTASADPTARWVGKDAARELGRAATGKGGRGKVEPPAPDSR